MPNLTENELTLAVKNIDCYDLSNTGNPSQITGRVLDLDETTTYRLEQSSRSRYDLGSSCAMAAAYGGSAR